LTDQLTLFAADTHASLFPQPGDERARQMTATSGQNLVGSWTSCGPLGSLEKTLLGTSAWASTTCFLTWRDRATPAGRLLFQLAPSAPRIGETEFGLWPTPNLPNGGRSIPPGSLIKGGLTPTAYRGGKKYQVDLNQAVRRGLWPMPTLQDAKNATQPPSQMNRDHLPGALMRKGISGSLNPTWVEWLMGFPAGWTDLKHSETP